MVFVESWIPFVLKAFDWSFQRQGICILAIDDGSDQCRGSDTVTEKILWPWSFQDSPVITFGDIDMMFIHDRCFRNNVQAFINFLREFLVIVRKLYCQFLVRKSVFDDTSRKSGQIGFTFADSFFTVVRRNDHLSDLRFF